ncbi:MAG: hypothetical protein KKF67_00955 [Nanoarchaeota archaeon]|nr:hypothetical protein [Nanoarchaeota archaeon]
MEKEIVKLLVEYAKKVSCVKEKYEDYGCQEKDRCLLYHLPYSFGEAGKSIRKRKFGEFEDEGDYHHTENLCFLLTHDQDITKFKKHLEDATLSITGSL